MNQQIIEVAMKQGIWAVLFIYLFYYQLKESRRREQESIERERKVLEFISDIAKQFEGLVKQYEKLSEDVQDIRMELSHQNKSYNSNVT
ncbi:BhlA/UviB family holin-like peptide [Paenibacillus sp. 2TAB26]|uniref:BhlA/UviB family holin-like peptide n=1 Tax=Paenibacillus sp. 2TAB26 TaxID=3233005 RepID=UPI003F9B7CEB